MLRLLLNSPKLYAYALFAYAILMLPAHVFALPAGATPRDYLVAYTQTMQNTGTDASALTKAFKPRSDSIGANTDYLSLQKTQGGTVYSHQLRHTFTHARTSCQLESINKILTTGLPASCSYGTYIHSDGNARSRYTLDYLVPVPEGPPSPAQQFYYGGYAYLDSQYGVLQHSYTLSAPSTVSYSGVLGSCYQKQIELSNASPDSWFGCFYVSTGELPTFVLLEFPEDPNTAAITQVILRGVWTFHNPTYDAYLSGLSSKPPVSDIGWRSLMHVGDDFDFDTAGAYVWPITYFTATSMLQEIGFYEIPYTMPFSDLPVMYHQALMQWYFGGFADGGYMHPCFDPSSPYYNQCSPGDFWGNSTLCSRFTIDSDADGRNDAIDTDSDGFADAFDTDGDCRIDAWDADGNGFIDVWADPVDPDAEDPTYFDTDGDGVPDQQDTDGDGVPDSPYTPPVDPNDPNNPPTDPTDPNNPPTDPGTGDQPPPPNCTADGIEADSPDYNGTDALVGYCGWGEVKLRLYEVQEQRKALLADLFPTATSDLPCFSFDFSVVGVASTKEVCLSDYANIFAIFKAGVLALAAIAAFVVVFRS